MALLYGYMSSKYFNFSVTLFDHENFNAFYYVLSISHLIYLFFSFSPNIFEFIIFVFSSMYTWRSRYLV